MIMPTTARTYMVSDLCLVKWIPYKLLYDTNLKIFYDLRNVPKCNFPI